LIFSPHCVDESSFQCDEGARLNLRQTARYNLGITDGKKVIIFSGKLSLRKGADLFLNSVMTLPLSIRKDVEIIFLGSGELKEKLERSARKQPEPKVHFAGFKNQSKLSPYYHASDLLVLPSYSDTWGLVVNEALLHGLPCVVSQAVGCAPDLIERGITGNVFKTGSVKDLSAVLEGSFELVNRPEIREKCRQKVSGYSVEKAAEGIANAYRSVLKNG
ncbi:MAG: glycosyltransferase family 4 protein, partial [Candidatus Omnitrophica bacterium]|nr:glycosyltransferase family 4 protein [Candidatus Omnitrophota bacterium]